MSDGVLLNRSGIYVIRNNLNGKAYVGSAVLMLRRWRHHRAALRGEVHHSRALQRAWIKYGEDAFSIGILELVPNPDDLIAREQHWIDQLQSSRPAHGYNVCPKAGSTLGRGHSDASRALMSAARSTPEARAANSARQVGRECSPEWLAKIRAQRATPEWSAKMRAAHLGRKATPAAREANRAGQLGRKHSAETRAKMAATASLRRHSEESKAKMSATKKGKKLGPRSPEHHAKLMAKQIGRKMSPETKAKISAKALLRGPMKEETKIKLHHALKGRVFTPEHVANIKAALAAKRRLGS